MRRQILSKVAILSCLFLAIWAFDAALNETLSSGTAVLIQMATAIVAVTLIALDRQWANRVLAAAVASASIIVMAATIVDFRRVWLEGPIGMPAPQSNIVLCEQFQRLPLPSLPDKIPPPSAIASVDWRFELGSETTVATVADRLETVLFDAGYLSKSYFRLDCGFAIVTQMERIKDDGSPASDRWNTAVNIRLYSFDLVAYLRALITMPQGRFRVIVFFVTGSFEPPSESVTNMSTTQAWIRQGGPQMAVLPETPYYPRFSTFAYIYEFEKTPETQKFVEYSSLLGVEHLVRAGIRLQ
jgi:hypothetical protein